MPDFEDVDLAGARFERVHMRGAELRDVDLTDATFWSVALNGVVMRGVELDDVSISGDIRDLVINGVDVTPYVTQELDRRYPQRAKMRPETPAGFVEAWNILETLWAQTVARARELPPELLDESVNDEWSFIQTLRHLVFATESWVGRAILGDPSPWDALSLPWGEMPKTPGVPSDFDARPSLETVLALRADRRAMVRRVIEGLTEESLNADTEPVEAVGWPEAKSYPVRRCLRIVLNEEWEHRLFAERDLTLLEAQRT